jgi:group I intron endonuclease
MDWDGRYNNYKNLNCKDQPALYNSFMNHGFKNHTFEILMQNVPEDILINLEKTWIYLEDTFNNGLNCTEGGEGAPGHKHTEEYKRNRSEAMKGENSPWFGKHLSEAHKLNISKGGKGKPKSEETKKRMSRYQTGRKRTDEQKKKTV